jgi:hypothetical protein
MNLYCSNKLEKSAGELKELMRLTLYATPVPAVELDNVNA